MEPQNIVLHGGVSITSEPSVKILVLPLMIA